ncbi:MAG: DNA-processing protein DprA [Acidobacteriota bacterium]|nr:DNA-processing protein DprA [Acidobacteriota bacterium]
MQTDRDSTVRDAIEVTLLPGVGTLTQNRIWKSLPDLSRLFSMNDASLAALGIPDEAHALIKSRGYRATAAEIYDWGIREGCRFLTRGSPEYPPLLAEIFNPPLVLYARGRLEVLQMHCIAIVGTRKPTLYGLQMAQGLASDLGSRGIGIISGLARGIDAAAHRGALEGKGCTIAVLGCGIDIVYPREHRQLTNRIVENGLILSEFPPGTSPSPQNFPVRNRIISGLALGTIIVEASEYSGSLITARLAMEQNREVFALPGNLTSPQSFGPNYLIKQGAKLVQSWRDVAEELPADVRHEMLLKEDLKPSSKSDSGMGLLSDDENRLLELLQTDAAIQFDNLLRLSHQTVSRLSDLLLNLEMNGRIRQLPGNLYVKLRK